MLPPVPALSAVRPFSLQAPEESLAAVLERLYWNASVRGPLLVVGPECYTPLRSPKEPPTDLFRFTRGEPVEDDAEADDEKTAPPAPLPDGPLNPGVLFSHFGLQVARLSGLSIAEPTRMVVPRPLQLTASQVEGLFPTRDTLLLFLTTLTESQWKDLGSATGLGEEQLEGPKQKQLFQRLFPAVVVAVFPQEPTLPKSDIDNPLPLAPTQRAGARLRLFQTLSLTAHGQGTEHNSYTLRDREVVPDPEAKLRRVVLLAPAKHLPDDQIEQSALVPTRPKPTQLDPASPALDAPIALEGATTVGELVGRIARATRLSLLCDKRIAGRQVWVRGKGTVRAGTALAALARGVQGAVRKLDTLYLLTAQVPTTLEQSEALALTVGGIEQSLSEKIRTLGQEAQQARAQLVRERAAVKIPRDSRSLAPEALWKLGSKRVVPRRDPAAPLDDDETPPLPETLPLASLPPFFHQQAQASYERQRAEAQKLGSDPPAFPTGVSARVYLQLEAVLPGLNARARLTSLPLEDIHPDEPLPTPPPPVTWPQGVTRAWHLPLPETDDQAEQLLTLARRCTVNELRLALPAAPDADERLARLAPRLQAAGIRLVPTVSIFQATKPEQRRDVDFLGRTAQQWSRSPLAEAVKGLEFFWLEDTLEPEGVDVAALVARVQRLLKLPGVSELGLTGLEPSGYGHGLSFVPLWSGGGQRSERLAFLQKEGLDPADIDQEDDTSDPEAQRKWWERKAARRDATLKRLETALKTAGLLPRLTAQKPDRESWERWRANLLQESPAGAVVPPPWLKSVALEDHPWRASGNTPEALLDETGQLRLWLQRMLFPPKSEGLPEKGFVLDATRLPVNEGLGLLERAFTEAASPSS